MCTVRDTHHDTYMEGRGQRAACSNQVPSSTMRFLGIKLGPGLVARAFTHLAILWALHSEIIYYILSSHCASPPRIQALWLYTNVLRA